MKCINCVKCIDMDETDMTVTAPASLPRYLITTGHGQHCNLSQIQTYLLYRAALYEPSVGSDVYDGPPPQMPAVLCRREK